MKEVDLGGRQVLLTFVEGKYFAFSKQCPHEEADLQSAGQLIDGRNAVHIWADTFDGVLDDIFELQDRITASGVS